MSPLSPTRASPALKAGLKLTAEQEKNWPAVETALRDLAKQRAERSNAMAQRREARRGNDSAAQPAPDAIARMREGADAMTQRAANLKKLADASEPLYKSLDDGTEAPLRCADPHGRPGRPLPSPRPRLAPRLTRILKCSADRLQPPDDPRLPGGRRARPAAFPVRTWLCRLFGRFAGQPVLTLLHDALLRAPPQTAIRAHSSVGRAADS